MAYPAVTQNSFWLSGSVQNYTVTFASPTSGSAITPSSGDLILVIDNIDEGSNIPGDVTDWTKLGGDSITNTVLLAYAKNSDGTETGITIPYTGTARVHNVRVLIIPGALVADIVSVAQVTGSGGSNINSPSVTTVTAENLAIFTMASPADTGSSANIPSGTTLVSYDVGSGRTLGIASLQVASAGATGTKTWTTATQAKRAWSIAIAPAAGGGAASITSVTGPASAADTVRATEDSVVAGSGFEATQAGGNSDIASVSMAEPAWADDEITVTGPTEGLMFGSGKTLTVTPDSNTPDSIGGISYLPPTGYAYVTYDGSTVVQNSVWWNRVTEAPVAGLTTGCQAYGPSTFTRVGGSETCEGSIEDGTGIVTLTGVTEPGDYNNTGWKLRDVADGLDSAAYEIYIDSTAPAGYTVSWDQASIDDTNHEAASFTFADAEVGATYEYTITSSGGGTPVTDTGTISTATDQITGIDVSGLGDGTLTLSVTLADTVGNEGTAATDTVGKDAIESTGAQLFGFTSYFTNFFPRAA